MKKHLFAFIFFVLLSVPAHSETMIDQALNQSLTQKAHAQKVFLAHDSVPKLEHSKSVEVLQVGDELGGFASAKGSSAPSNPSSQTRSVVGRASDAPLDRELRQINSEL
jgi:hypothetical protein